MMSSAAIRDAASLSDGTAIGGLADTPAPEAATGPRSRSGRRLQIGESIWRFGLVGVLSNTAGYCAYLLLTWLGGGAKTSMTLLYAVGALLGFIGNRAWVFRDEGPGWPSLIRYGFAYFVGYALDWLLLYVFVDRSGYPHELVQAAAVGIVAAYLFPTLRFFVFRSVQASEPRLSLSSP